MPASPTPILLEDTFLPPWHELAEEFWAEKDFYLVPCGHDPPTVINCAHDLAPCILVLSRDALPPYLGQINALVGIPGLRMMVRGDSDEAEQGDLLAMGVLGFLATDASAGEIHKALKAVSRGEIWARRHTVSTVLTKLVFHLNAEALSDREREILRYITEGYKNREIANRLCISRDTVRWHIRSLYVKIGVTDRLSAVLYGRRFLAQGVPLKTS